MRKREFKALENLELPKRANIKMTLEDRLLRYTQVLLSVRVLVFDHLLINFIKDSVIEE